MQVRLLYGRAGSGKTFGCLNEARRALCASPEGPALVLVAPKQGTYQLEQQLLAGPELAGYTRLSILSFESLARFVFDALGRPCCGLLSEEGRVMVLRALLARHRDSLKVFRASARLTGFAQQLSQALAEIQRAQLDPDALRRLASSVKAEDLGPKLEDLANLLERYQDWLGVHELDDEGVLLNKAAELLRNNRQSLFRIETLWVDGFAEFTDLELDLLAALLPFCGGATVTFCLEAIPQAKRSWLSHWSTVSWSFEKCRKRFAAVANVEVLTQKLESGGNVRLADNPVLRHLETLWELPAPYCGPASDKAGESLCLVECPTREAEVTAAAREIRAFVRAGGRYREASVLVRTLDSYYQLIHRIFSRYEIPFFLDRRESVSHHALAELTRSAVRLVAFGWQQQDWFGALKTGLVPAEDEEVDLLENEGLARGWKGQIWHQPIHLRDQPKNDSDRSRLQQLEKQLESIRSRLVPPFEKFTLGLAISGNRPTGPELAVALRQLWGDLAIERQLEDTAPVGVAGHDQQNGTPVNETVWRQMNLWLDNAALAFPHERLPLREWVAVLESGLASLTIGIIPPSMDQVLVGAVDRSRTPEVKLALVLGLNESVFPALPQIGSILTEADRQELENRDIALASSKRHHIGRERYLGYIACTRARQRLVLTWAALDPAGTTLLPSPLLSIVTQMFPAIRPIKAPLHPSWTEAEHASELVETLLTLQQPDDASESVFSGNISEVLSLGPIRGLMEQLKHLVRPQGSEQLAPELAARLYGPVLRTSVSRMEQFAACPFQFFVRSGLRAEERRLFELDAREQGTFQHDVLALFHAQLRSEGKRWRDITPAEARERIAQTSRGLMSSFRDGLLEGNSASRFTAAALTESLQDFVETLVEWTRSQYLFDPVEVELPFGEDEGSPAWSLDLGDGNRIDLYGRIDRVDLHRQNESDRAKCIVIDYKSSHKQLDPLLVTHGLQLQLLSYLNVVRQWPNPREAFGVDRIEPAGVFYVNLRGAYKGGANRVEALADPNQTRKMAYRHSGRFDKGALRLLDHRADVLEGDQFNYRLRRDLQIHRNCREAISADELQELLERVAASLRGMGKQIYGGHAEVSPYRFGALAACSRCMYQAICRVDPWTQDFRVLRRETAAVVSQPEPIPA